MHLSLGVNGVMWKPINERLEICEESHMKMLLNAQMETCLYCGDKLKGRSDKKFCNEYCRNSYNNEQKGKERASIKRVDQILKRNRKVLAETILDASTIVVDKLSLIQKGFDGKFHTHQLVNRKHETYNYCYDIGWKEIDGGLKVMIVWDTSLNDHNEKRR